MTLHSLRRLVPMALLLAVGTVAASPGAHGPNGEHLDMASAGPVLASTEPRLESFSDLFELVARLRRDALVIDLGRYVSNEAVGNASIEVESGAVKATASLDAASGSYRVTDPAFLRALTSPGAHALLFTIAAGKDTDLLEGTLQVAAQDAPGRPEGGVPASVWPVAAAAAFVGGVALLGWRRGAARRQGGRA